MFPFYLQNKLALINIFSIDKLNQVGYLKAYKWLKEIYPSLGYNALYDLHSISHNIPINTLCFNKLKLIRNEYKRQLPTYLPLKDKIIALHMSEALSQANLAAAAGEIPIGCVIVKNNMIIGMGYNQTLVTKQITAHAEIMAINEATKYIATHRLDECDLYVTVEPCLMCMGAIMHSRIRRVIFGAMEPKTGAIISQYKVLNNIELNKHTEAIGPLDRNEKYVKPLQDFLKRRR